MLKDVVADVPESFLDGQRVPDPISLSIGRPQSAISWQPVHAKTLSDRRGTFLNTGAGRGGLARSVSTDRRVASTDFLDVAELLELRESMIKFLATLRRRRLAQIGDGGFRTRHLLDLG